jgi:hypothetical protein
MFLDKTTMQIILWQYFLQLWRGGEETSGHMLAQK